MRRKQSEQGYSLVELMVVVAILIIIAAIAAPTLFQTIRRYQAEGNARKVASLIARARSEAARRNQRVQTIAVYNASSVSYRFGLDLDLDDTLDADEPYVQLPYRTYVIPYTAPVPASDFLNDPEYTNLAYNSRINFSPHGVLLEPDGSGGWQLASDIQVVYAYTWRGGFWGDHSHIFPVAVTPAGRVRPFRYQPGSGYIPMERR